MRLADRVDSGPSNDTVTLRIVDMWYEIAECGYQGQMPVLNYHGRTTDGEYHHFQVENFRPYFYISTAEDVETVNNLEKDRRVLDIEPTDRKGVAEGTDQVDLIKVTVEVPWHVAQLRDEFDRTWEADVRFPHRFLIDCAQWSGHGSVKAHLRVPDTGERLQPNQVKAVDDRSIDADTSPRVVTWDLEIYNEGEVPDTKVAQFPVTAVCVHDNYEDDYVLHVLKTDGWDGLDDSTLETEIEREIGTEVDATIHSNEKALLSAIVEYLLDRRPDVITGWYNCAFDAPYFVNRCLDEEVWGIKELSPTGKVERHEDEGRFINGDITGVHIFDLLDGYKKSQYHELKSSSLEDVAEAELGIEKLDVDEQDAWTDDPVAFSAYNVRDVEATVGINEEVNLI